VPAPLVTSLMVGRGAGQAPPLPRGPLWLVIGVVLHLAWVFGASRFAGVPPWLCWLPVAADVPIVVFLGINRRVPGAAIVLLGLGLNVAAMAANGGLMPITLDKVPGPHVASRFDGDRLRLSTDRVVSLGAPLAALGDVIAIGGGGGRGVTISIGDLFIVGGCLVVATRYAGLGMAPHERK
jgi:hypothetical protein